MDLISTLIMIAVFVLFFVFMSRSNKKREAETRRMLDSLQVGDEVMTTSGIIGQIVSIKDETVVIETSRENTKIRFLKTAIARVDVAAIDSISAPKSVKKAAAKAQAEAARMQTEAAAEVAEESAPETVVESEGIPEEKND